MRNDYPPFLSFQNFVVKFAINCEELSATDENIMLRISKTKTPVLAGFRGLFEKLLQRKWFTDSKDAQRVFAKLCKHYVEYRQQELESSINYINEVNQYIKEN